MKGIPLTKGVTGRWQNNIYKTRDGKECRLSRGPRTQNREPSLLIVKRCHLQRPDVRLHRLLAAGGVLLRTVGGLVSGYLRGVFEAGVDSSGDGAEARTLLDLRGLDGR